MRRPWRNRFREEELAALADGSLREDRSDAIEAHVAGSPELASRLDEQRRALELIDAAAVDVEAPAGLRARVEAERRPRRARNRPLALAAGFAVAAAAALVLVLTLPRGVGGPDFAEAATLGTRPAAGTAPQPLAGEPKLLDAALENVPFPNWAEEFGWRATGVRTDQIGGRDTVTVFYEKKGRRIAYTIVSGDALDTPGDTTTIEVEGTPVEIFRADGTPAATWERDGHTCVLLGDGVEDAKLAELAGWRAKGEIPF